MYVSGVPSPREASFACGVKAPRLQPDGFILNGAIHLKFRSKNAEHTEAAE
jgi:hypothetical protein